MATTDDDTTTAPAPATASPDLLAQLGPLIKQLMPQPVQQDTTPVSRSWTSLLGQALAGGPPVAGMSDADKETAGSHALMDFGTGLMAASRYQPGQTLFSNLAGGFQGAKQGEIGAEEMAMAKLGAQQEYAQQQGQNKLEAIKTALPFLRMAQGAGMPNLLAGGGAPPAPNVAQGGSIATVARDPNAGTAGQQGNNSGNLMADNSLPPGAVGRIPVSGGRFVAAFPDVPTGVAAQSDNLTAYAKQGVNTIRGAVNRWVGDPKANTDSYAADVAKAAGVDPDAPVDLSDPKIQRAFLLAQQPHESGKSWLQPSDVDKGIALAVARRGVPGGPPVVGAPAAVTTATTPPAPVVHTSPALRGPGTPVPPTPQPSIQGTPDTGGGTLVGGPGALPGKVAPPGPAVPGDVNAIIGGMKGAGAAPATLAPGAATAGPAAPTIAQGGPPTVTPPAQPAPQVSAQGDQPPAPTGPLTIEQYRAQHPSVIDPSTYTVTAPDLSHLISVEDAAKLQLSRANAGLGGDPNKSLSDYNTAAKAVADAQAAAAAKSVELRQAAQKNADDLTLQGYNAYMQRQQDAEQKQKDRDAAVSLKKLEGQQAIQQAGVTSDVQAGQKALEAVNATREGAQDTVNTLEMAKNLSKQAGTSGFLQQWPQVANALVRNNLLTPDEVQQLGAQRSLDAVMNKVILSMRSGSGMSRMTNFDLQFLQNTAPSSFTPEQMRPAMFAAIQTAATRQVEYADRVNELHASGMPVWQARQQADTDLGHMVKETPTTYPQGDPRAGQPMSADDQNKWIIRNVTPGTFYTQPGGALAIRGEGKQGQQ